jgi:large subunit ribosomal protein L1
MGSKKNVDMSVNNDEIKIVGEGETEATTEAAKVAAKKPKKERHRSHKYIATRSQVDKTKTYDAFAAIEMVKKLSYSKFAGTITADVVLKDVGTNVTITFPHSTGKTIKAVIASDEVIAQIEAGTIDFDILVTSPQYMPKLAKLARVLGPKGLMPNPKNGTITDNPERKKAELEGGQVTLKSEKKAPLMHVSIGKASMDTKDLVENLNALITALQMKAVKMSISATMSPSVKVAIE